jgi:uncharacterized iron-regulated membrane protein
MVAATGTLIVFKPGVRKILDAPEPSMPASPADGPYINLATAITLATETLSGSQFADTTMPSPADTSYYVWMWVPSELYRSGFDSMRVIIDAKRDDVRAIFDATKAEPKQAFVGSLYPLHTGEAGGTTGRALVFAVGLWLATSIALGVCLWLNKRTVRRKEGPNS